MSFRSLLLPFLACAAPAALGQQQPALTAAHLFDDTVLHEVRLEMHPSDWARLRRDFHTNDYYPADLTWRGRTVQNVGIRSRGFGSRNGVKPGLRVDCNRFEEAQEFLGLKSFVLKPNVQDPSQMHERLAMLFYAQLGLPAPRLAHARLYVNNEYAGLYTMVESVDKNFLRQTLGEDDGYLYQYEWVAPYRFEYLGPDPSRYVPSPFQPETHERNPDPGPLVAMIRQMNQAPDGEFATAIAPYLDLKRFMTHLAVETFLAEADGILSPTGIANFFLYRFEGKNLFTFLPWDKDRTFSDPEAPIFRNFTDNVLASRALAVPEARRAFLEALVRCAILAGGPQGWLEYRINRIFEQIQAAAREDPYKLCPDAQGVLQSCSNTQFETGVQQVREFAAARGEVVRRAVASAGFQIAATAPRLAAGAGALTPGSLASLAGERLSDTEAAAEAFPLPTNLGGLAVFVNGFPAPLLLVTPAQVNLQVPWEAAGERAEVTVVWNGVVGNSATVDLGQSPPVVFGVTHEDGAAVTAARPAAAGDVLIVRATGLGPVSGSPQTGRPAPEEPPMHTREPPSVTIGGAPAEVLSARLAPGLAGVYQIHVRASAGTPAGSATPLVVSVGSQASEAWPTATR